MKRANLIKKMRHIVEERDTISGRIFDYVVQSLIVISLISFSIETLPDLPANMRRLLRIVEILTVAAFTVEYLLRVAVARRRLRFVFSFFGLIDLCAILPFYVASGIDLRSMRAFRLLRLFRALKLLRYSQAIKRFPRGVLVGTGRARSLLLSIAASPFLFSCRYPPLRESGAASGVFFDIQ